MLGTRVTGLDALDAEPDARIAVRLMPPGSAAWQLKAHYARYAAWVAREGARWRPDWVYASDVLGAPLALTLSALTGARVLYHEHDAPSLEHQSWAYRQCLAARDRLLRRADIVVAPNAERAARLGVLGGGRSVITAWNCPPRPRARPVRARRSDRLRVIYRGSINGDRLPSTVVDAVARTSSVHLDIAGYETAGSRGHVDRLMARATQLGVSDRVQSLGTVASSVLEAICAESDVGLALMPMQSDDENMQHMTGASNKVFEYLASGVAPLVSDLADWRTTFVAPGCSLACDPRSPESIAAVLAWSRQHRNALDAIADRGWQRLQADWNYETQFAPIMRALWTAVDPASAGVTTESPREAECVS
jgi:glycosyltransferase involved in cell wall biosynthesis